MYDPENDDTADDIIDNALDPEADDEVEEDEYIEGTCEICGDECDENSNCLDPDCPNSADA